MQAIGMIETKGLLAAIEGADSMTKSANINILEKVYVGGGLVTIVITGDVGAVRAAIDAGVTAVRVLGDEFLISEHIIPRPHEELKNIMKLEKENKEIINKKTIEEIKKVFKEDESNKRDSEIEKIELEEIKAVNDESLERVIKEKKITKKEIERYLRENKKEELISDLTALKISELRKLLKEHKELNLTSKTVSKMDKENLINKILEIYNLRGER